MKNPLKSPYFLNKSPLNGDANQKKMFKKFNTQHKDTGKNFLFHLLEIKGFSHVAQNSPCHVSFPSCEAVPQRLQRSLPQRPCPLHRYSPARRPRSPNDGSWRRCQCPGRWIVRKQKRVPKMGGPEGHGHFDSK